MGLNKSRFVLILVFLVLVSPVFSIFLADLFGYREPLDLVAEFLGLKEISFFSAPFEDYSLHGLNPFLAYVLSGVIGVAVIYILGLVLSKLASFRRGDDGVSGGGN